MSTTATLNHPSRFARSLALDVGRVKEHAPLGALLVLTAGLYLWGLSRNGFANQYYAAAVHAGAHSWKAFLFGSLDTANYITVDKPPASLWLMELSSRLFGFSSLSMLLPQALEGVAAVALVYATVRRWFGRPAALMFRFNNPDALLVLLLVLSAYGVTRALEQGRTRWLVLAGSALGFGFLTKELQAFLVVPAFAIAYLVGAPVPLRRRLWQLALAGVALVASAGWWLALVELWPASARPYIGGSTDNSVMQLVFGYNGLDRLSSGGSGGAGLGFSGSAGILRLFNSELGGQIGWLLPAAGIVLIAGIGWTLRRPRTDRTRAALLLWGGWLVLSAAVYSFMTGIIHPYYTNTLAPAIAVLVGVGATLLWRRRGRLGARLLVGTMLLSTGAVSYALLDRAPAWHPWLRYAILAASLLTAAVIAAYGGRLRRAVLAAVVVSGLAAALAGPTAYTLSTVATAESGSNVSAGPAIASGRGFAGGGGGARGQSTGSALSSLLARGSSHYTWVAATSSAQTAATLELATGKSVMAIGGFSGSDPAITLARFEQLVAAGKIHYYVSAQALGGGSGGGPPGAGSRGGPGGGSGGVESQIQTWVAAHFSSRTVGGATVYDLTQSKASSA